MAFEDYLVPVGKSTNICFDCQKACGDCSWSRSFEPVPGWTARKVTQKINGGSCGKRWEQTYHITACPEFVADPPRKSNNLALGDRQFLRMEGRTKYDE